jgi:hypothetical protein
MRSRVLPLAAFGALVLYLAIGIPLGLRNTALRLRAALKTAGMPPAAVRARVFGPLYVAGVERVRRAIPENEPYLLAEQDIAGAMLWVRFDLLPRRAVAAGTEPLGGDCLVPQLRWVVVAVATGRPPRLLERRPVTPPGCPPAPWLEPAPPAAAAADLAMQPAGTPR